MISEAFGFGDQRHKSTVEQHTEIFGGLTIIVVFQEVYINVTYDEYFFSFRVSRKCSRSFDGCR